MAKKTSKKPPQKTDILKDKKLMEILAGFVQFRYEMNVMNATLKPYWLSTIAHYTICISVLHSRMSRGSVRPKSEALFVMQGRMPAARVLKVAADLVQHGYIEERPLQTDGRRIGYWAADKLVMDCFKYLLTAWEINYHSEDGMDYFRGLTDDIQYLFETPEGKRVRALYDLTFDDEEVQARWNSGSSWGLDNE